MAITGLILFLIAVAMFVVGLLGVMPAGAALGIFLLIPAAFALGVAVTEGEGLHLRHRRVR